MGSIQNHVVAVISTFDPIVSMVTEKLGLPYIVLSFIEEDDVANVSDGRLAVPRNVFHMLPRCHDVSQALLDVMTTYSWKKVAVLYEDHLSKDDPYFFC